MNLLSRFQGGAPSPPSPPASPGSPPIQYSRPPGVSAPEYPALGAPLPEDIMQQRRLNELAEAWLSSQAGAVGGGGPPYMAQLAEQQRQFDLTQNWLREQLAAQQAMEQAALAQRQREMGASIGQGIAGLQSQQWAQGLPFQLPEGTHYAPGHQMGGPIHQMARQAGMTYMPTRVPEAPPPSREQMTAWLESAISQFGS